MAHALSLSVFIAITAAGVVPCGGPKKSPRTASIVQIISYFWSFEINGNILIIQKLIQQKRLFHHGNISVQT